MSCLACSCIPYSVLPAAASLGNPHSSVSVHPGPLLQKGPCIPRSLQTWHPRMPKPLKMRSYRPGHRPAPAPTQGGWQRAISETPGETLTCPSLAYCSYHCCHSRSSWAIDWQKAVLPIRHVHGNVIFRYTCTHTASAAAMQPNVVTVNAMLQKQQKEQGDEQDGQGDHVYSSQPEDELKETPSDTHGIFNTPGASATETVSV